MIWQDGFMNTKAELMMDLQTAIVFINWFILRNGAA